MRLSVALGSQALNCSAKAPAIRNSAATVLSRRPLWGTLSGEPLDPDAGGVAGSTTSSLPDFRVRSFCGGVEHRSICIPSSFTMGEFRLKTQFRGLDSDSLRYLANHSTRRAADCKRFPEPPYTQPYTPRSRVLDSPKSHSVPPAFYSGDKPAGWPGRGRIRRS